MSETKTKLRHDLVTKRQAMGFAEIDNKSQLVIKKLITDIDWVKIRSAHIYKSVPAWKEVDTAPLIKFIEDNYPLVKIVCPESKQNAPMLKQRFDLIIVPVLGFDKDAHRIGLGGGWYDRFLSKQPQAQKIGLAYSWALTNSFPVEPHDITLDKVITDSIIIPHDSEANQNYKG